MQRRRDRATPREQNGETPGKRGADRAQHGADDRRERTASCDSEAVAGQSEGSRQLGLELRHAPKRSGVERADPRPVEDAVPAQRIDRRRLDTQSLEVELQSDARQAVGAERQGFVERREIRRDVSQAW